MNYLNASIQISSNPREIYVSDRQTATACDGLMPPVGKKAPTPIKFQMFGKAGTRLLSFRKDTLVFVYGARLIHDHEAHTYTVSGGDMVQVTDQFPIINTIILAGRCIKTIDVTDSRQFATLDSGLMIARQSLSVYANGQSCLYNIDAISGADDKPCNAKILTDFARKGTGLTVGGKIVTSAYIKEGEAKTRTSIVVNAVTFSPKPKAVEPPPQTTVADGESVGSLWGGKTADTGGVAEEEVPF